MYLRLINLNFKFMKNFVPNFNSKIFNAALQSGCCVMRVENVFGFLRLLMFLR